VLPGCCWSCAEPITSRQGFRVFLGPNVLLPTALDDPAFHTRQACREGARSYEEAWVRADPSRPRSLLTLFCEGTVIVHGDGSAECFGAKDSECPNVRARHRTSAACYYQSHGCPRGCSRSGHPGTRISAAANPPAPVPEGQQK
jgi:hypothetical protein